MAQERNRRPSAEAMAEARRFGKTLGENGILSALAARRAGKSLNPAEQRVLAAYDEVNPALRPYLGLSTGGTERGLGRSKRAPDSAGDELGRVFEAVFGVGSGRGRKGSESDDSALDTQAPFKKLNLKGKQRTVAAVTAAVIAVGAVGGAAYAAKEAGIGPFAEAGNSQCDSDFQWKATGRTVSEIADQVAQAHGWDISPERLVFDNNGAFVDQKGKVLQVRESNGDIKEELDRERTVCVLVSAPLDYGPTTARFEANGNQSLSEFALAWGLDLQKLREDNAAIVPEDNNEKLKKGTLLWSLVKETDGWYFLRPLHEPSIDHVTGGDQTKTANLRILNAPLQGDPDRMARPFDGSDDGFRSKDPEISYYLPLENHHLSEELRARGLTVAGIVQMYDDMGAYLQSNAHTSLADLVERQQPSPEATEVKVNPMSTVPEPYRGIFTDAAAERGTDPRLLAALFLSEHRDVWVSADSRWASSPTGAQGPFQFMPGTFAAHAQPGMGDIQNLTHAAYAAADLIADLGITPQTPLGDINYPFKDQNTVLWAVAQYSWGGGNVRDYTNPDMHIDNPSIWPDKRAYLQNVFNLLKPGSNLTQGAGGQYYPETVEGAVEIPETTVSPEIPVVPGQINLEPEKYYSSDGLYDQSRWSVYGIPESWTVAVNGGRLSLADGGMSWEQRYQIVENELNRINLSAEGFQAFTGSVKDITDQTESMSNFTREPFGSINEVQFYVAHYTVTNHDNNDTQSGLTGLEAANSMQNAGNGIGSYKFLGKDGQVWILTYNKTINVPNYNHNTRGTEVEARSQETITAKQYEALLYSFAHDLIKDGRITKDMSAEEVGAVVDRMVKGHGEFNVGVQLEDGRHTDFQKVVMDPLRGLLKDFLTNKMGY
ncbi:MAG TPA: hypothetical protein VLF20_00920 [Patescibacteria group bacterium]|nr:hypothetical protein [Patescibacteria group bacterium]